MPNKKTTKGKTRKEYKSSAKKMRAYRSKKRGK